MIATRIQDVRIEPPPGGRIVRLLLIRLFVTDEFQLQLVDLYDNGNRGPFGKECLFVTGLDIAPEDIAELLTVDAEAFKEDLADGEAYLTKFGDKVPERLRAQVEAQKTRLG